MGCKNWLDHRPGGFNRILTGKQRAVTGHGICQEPRIGCFLFRMFIKQIKFLLIADELLAYAFNASSKGYYEAGREPEAQIVGSTIRRS